MKWVTRERPKVDRIACPWPIARFIDLEPEFVYVPAKDVMRVAETTGAIPFDMPGLELGHVGESTVFDTFVKKYELKHRALPRLAAIIRGADTGRFHTAEQAAGLHAIAHGMARVYADDQELLQRGMLLYEELYAWARCNRTGAHDEVDYERTAQGGPHCVRLASRALRG